MEFIHIIFNLFLIMVLFLANFATANATIDFTSVSLINHWRKGNVNDERHMRSPTYLINSE